MLSVNKEQYTSDKIIRKALFQLVVDEYKNHPAKIIEEFSVCNGLARVDLAAINGIMHGFEIKSDIDSLERLPQQLDLYNLVFDKVTLVVGGTHLYEAFNIIPDWWGVTVARVGIDNKVTFNQIREPSTNLQIDAKSVAQLLWKDEALTILEEIGITKGYKSKNRNQISDRLVQEFDISTLTQKVRDSIVFNRQGWRVGA